jgi:hypothetical protein
MHNLVATTLTLSSLIFTPLVANAATMYIDTFEFSQIGYTDGGTLTGTFVATVGSSDLLGLSDLQSISYTFSFANTELFANSLSPATLFSYDLIGGSSSFALEGGIGINSTVCVGSPAAFCDRTNTSGINGYINYDGSYTTALQSVTLVSSVPVVGNPPTMQVPEPSPLLATLTFGILSTGIFVNRKRRHSSCDQGEKSITR